MSRDRSSGWQHAKLSGHENEELVCELLRTDVESQERLKKIAKLEDAFFVDCDCGGLHETDIPSVIGGKTKNKADLTARFSNGRMVGISVKKSLSGQVYLIKDDTFVKGMEVQYGIVIPPIVKRAVKLFWGSASDTVDIIKQYSMDLEIRAYELHKNRLTADTLKKYDESLYDALRDWFMENIHNITDFCFSRGLALSPDDSASVIWYKNMLGEHEVDYMQNINDLCARAEAHKTDISYGQRNGGTVINLPFGFVQWHQACMQFHHKYDSIVKLWQ